MTDSITYSHSENPSYTDKVFDIIYHVFRNIQGLITIFVNLLTIIVIVRYKRLHTSSNVLIVSLAVADLVTGLSTLIVLSDFIIVSTTRNESVWMKTCLVATWLSLAASSGNVVHMFTISLDRFLAIRNPVFYHQSVSKRRMIVAVTVVWLLIILHTTVCLLFGVDPDLGIGVNCIWTSVFTDEIFWYMLAVPYVIMSTTSTSMYVYIGLTIRNLRNKIFPQNTREGRRMLQQRKVTKMMALVIVMYYILYLPVLVESHIKYDVTVKFYVNKVVHLLFFTNALINPFIYSRQSMEFNAAYRKILRCNKRIILKFNRKNKVIKMGRPSVYTVCLNKNVK